MTTADKQPAEQPTRDEKGHFLPGNPGRFKPGESGNLAGRPMKGDALADIIAEIMEQEEATLTGGEVVPPGEALKEVIAQREMSQKELAKQTGLSTTTIRGVMRGKTAITPETALRFEKALGLSAEFWILREAAYAMSKRDMWTAIVSRIALLAHTSKDHNIALKAAAWLADRQYGRARQATDLNLEGGGLLGPVILPVLADGSMMPYKQAEE